MGGVGSERMMEAPLAPGETARFGLVAGDGVVGSFLGVIGGELGTTRVGR